MNISLKVLPDECPFCHATPDVVMNPLWHGDHGYRDNYEYYVACTNTDCKVRPRTRAYNDIYGMTQQACIEKSVDDWNTR